ncbi:PAS domain S-box protein [Halorubrum sp. SS7]|uniref:hybrid sensor histidine kinase/response regulator n=4 Tax=unclassified Halorubrum TaxID=2642239 RepID=UPI0013054785|nr:PAS domain S-box protein [Halorubrum sp. SS7]
MVAQMEPITDSIRVLYVDDEPEFAEMAATFLGREDDRFDVEIVSSGTEGSARLADESFDCVISDYDMPGQNGIEFLETVRDDHPDLPFILHTGKGSEEVASDAISAGVTDYIQKSGSADQYALLANRILNAVEAHRSRRIAAERTRRLETLISNLPGMVYRCRNEPTWPMETVRGEVEDLTGYSVGAIEGDDGVVWGEDILHPDDREEMWATVQSELSAGDTFEVTYRIVTEDGETRWMWERGRGVYADDGELDALEGFITDITERKQREQELAESESRYRTLAENFPNGGVFYVDREFRYQIVSGSGFDPLDTDPDDIVGRTVSEVERFPEELIETIEAVHETTLAGESERIEVPYEDRVFEIRTAPVREDGDVVAGLHIARDITERREREEELQRQNERLEKFARVVSHDLRNPLNVVEGRLELARSECDSDQLVEAEQALERGQALVDDLLSLAREGKVVTETEPVPLKEVVEGRWAGVETGDATLNVDIDRAVMADRGRLKQLLENLIRNAIDHVGPEVTVEVGRLADGFYVADDGPGIAAADREAVFESAYSTVPDNTGFGLAIVGEIADAHGWDVTVAESAAGGARFEITGVRFAA